MKSSSKKISVQPKKIGSAKQPLGLNSILKWRDLFVVLAVFIIAYQASQLTTIKSQLSIQQARIIELERPTLKDIDSSSNSSIVNKIIIESVPPSIVEGSPKDDNAVEEHAPHSHYAIETIDGVPVNPGKMLGFLILYNRC